MVTPEQAARQAEALAKVRAARIRRDRANEQLNQEIRAALDTGARPKDVAVAAELSRQRVSQISRCE